MRLAIYGVSGTKYVGDVTAQGDLLLVDNGWLYFPQNPTFAVQASSRIKVTLSNVEAVIDLTPAADPTAP